MNRLIAMAVAAIIWGCQEIGFVPLVVRPLILDLWRSSDKLNPHRSYQVE